MSAVLQEKRAVILNPQRMALAEQWRQDWVVNAEEGTSIEDVLDPEYFSHMASQMQQFDRIEVRMETGEWVAELIVKAVGRNWVSCHLIVEHQLEVVSDAPAATIKHDVMWRGQHHKWCVKRKSDGEVLQAGMASKDDAETWLKNYESTIHKA
jgi:hypothetical protein